jgi:enoyl-CoA hydratase/carnithine racemase
MTDATVIARIEGRVGLVRLNRPKALNALDLSMIRAIGAALAAWRDEPHIHAVLVESSSDRAFCAGGDIRAIRDLALAGDEEAIRTYFTEEYALNAAIASYPKPYIAMIDGICMGGGIGISVHSDIRVATEHGLFAMPETAIGMFPDIGATHMLPRLPGELGMFLGLTGTRLGGADAVHVGIATHLVPRENLPALCDAVVRDGVAPVAVSARELPPFSLAPHRAAIDRCFSADSVPAIVARLEAEGGQWADATLATLRSMSPSALCWTFAALRRGAGLTLTQALAAELRLVQRVTRHPDFAEGVRAMVVDKDRQPRWSPATLAEVDPEAISAMLD